MIATAPTHAMAATVHAIKASGAIVRVRPEDLAKILARQDEPLVVVCERRFFRTTFRYLTSYKGLAFYAKSAEPIPLPVRCEVIPSDRMWLPE